MVGPERLEKDLENLNAGDHIACIYKNKKEQLSIVIPFILTGLKDNLKCIYIADENTKHEIIETFRKVINIDEYINSNQVEVLTKDEAYLRDGFFDPDKMIELLRQNEKKALKDGYNGLRVTGEMTWIFTTLPGVERLMEYEAKLNYFFPESSCSALCQYNEKKFKPEILLDVIRTHPKIIIYDTLYENPRYQPPDEFFAQMRGEIHLKTYEKARDTIIQRKRMEKMTEQQEREKKLILDSMSGFVSYYGADKKIQWVNKAAAALNGNEDLVGKYCYEVWHCIDEPCEVCPAYTVWETKTYEEGEITTVDGRTWHKKDSPVYDHGELVGVVEVAQDITARKKAEENLRASEEKYRELVENINDVIYAINKEGILTYVSPSIQSFVGYDPSEITGRDFREFIYTEDLERLNTNFRSVLSGKNSTNEYRAVAKSGDIRWMRTSSHPLFVGDHVTGVQGVLTDITEQKYSEEALKKSEEELRLIFENAKDAILWADTETGTIIRCNKAAEILLGKKREEILGHHQTEVHPPQEKEYYAALFKEHVDLKKEVDSEAEVVTSSGKRVPVHITASVTVVGGTPIIQAIFRDVTEQKRIEEEKNEILHGLNERVKELSCLYGIDEVMRREDATIEEVLEEVVRLIPPSWQHTDVTGSRIILDDRKTETKNFAVTEWMQRADIIAHNKPIGAVEVCYLGEGSAEKSPFLEEETRLINSIARRLGEFIEKREAEFQLKSLFEASKLINSTMDMEELFSLISHSVQELVGFDNFVIFLVSKDRLHVYPAYSSKGIRHLMKGLTFHYGEGLIGHCIETTEPVLSESFSGQGGITSNPQMNSQIGVPLIVEGNCVGALHISKSAPNAYGQRDVDILKPLSEIISLALRNSQLHNEIKKFNQELEKMVEEKSRRTEVLLDAKQKLQTETSWEKGLATIVDSMCKFGFEGCGVFLVNPTRKTLEIHRGKGFGFPDESISMSLRDTEYPGVQCIRDKKIVYVKDAATFEGKKLFNESYTSVWIPIVVQDEAFAAIAVVNQTEGKTITDEDIKDLGILAGTCAAFIDRTRTMVEPIAEKTLKTEIKHWLNPSESYIIIEKKPQKSFEMFVDLVTHGISGFVISREHPEKVKKKYNLVRTPLLWLSRAEVNNTLDPDDLAKLTYLVGNFTRKNGESVILLDGLEYLISQTGFHTVLGHLQELKDTVAMNGSRLIIPLHKGTLTLQEYSILERGFAILELDGKG